MLRRLEIRNFGLISDAAIAFDDGATMFTGETGSGKTMILGALSFALGARAAVEFVGRFAQRTVVTLWFEPHDALAAALTRDGYGNDPGEDASIERELTAPGKSAMRLNGRATTAAHVRSIAAEVAEVVGQHDAQRLLSPAHHLQMLDRSGGDALQQLRDRVASSYGGLEGLLRERHEARARAHVAEQQYAEAREALERIESVRPQVQEDERLETRRRYLDSIGRIALALQGAHDALAGEDYSCVSGLGAARSSLDAIRDLAPAFGDLAASAASLQEETTDLAARIAREAEETEFDTRELEALNERLDALDRLKRSFGGTLDAVLAHAATAQAVVDAFEGRDEALSSLDASIEVAEAALCDAAAALKRARTAAASALADRVAAEFPDLALGSARFECRLFPLAQPGAAGGETAEFYFAANAGETPRPLARIASGGELSRVLLALVVATTQVSDAALVFDEIDTGVGGATGTAVGARLGRLARGAQVVCVTHLAQLAMWAGRHYVLEKREAAGTTVIAVNEIRSDDARAAELARMLSGESHDIALQHARALIAQAAL